MRSARVARAVAGMFVAACCAATATVQADPDPAPGPAPGPVPGTAAAPPPAPKNFIDKDGTYAVGTDIIPGTYVSDGPVSGSACYWKRLNGDQIIDNTLSKKPQVVQIAPTDTAFKTDRCQPWRWVECQENCPTTEQQPPPALPGLFPDFGLPQPPAPVPGAGQ